MSSKFVCGLMLTAAFTISAAPARADAGWSFSTGADYTTGKYGEDITTNILIIPFSAAYSTDRWRFGVTAPYVRVDGSGNIVPGAGAAPGGLSGAGDPLSTATGGVTPSGLFGSTPAAPAPPTPTRIEEQGLGDITLSVGVTPLIASNGARLAFGLDVRTPTGDEAKSLGAGQTIAALSVGYSHPIGERSAIYGGVGYQRAFDSGADSVTATIGAEGYITEHWMFGASAQYAQASLDRQANQSQASLYAGLDVSPHLRLVGYAVAGLTDTAPDSGGGVRLVFHP